MNYSSLKEIGKEKVIVSYKREDNQLIISMTIKPAQWMPELILDQYVDLDQSEGQRLDTMNHMAERLTSEIMFQLFNPNSTNTYGKK